MENMVIQKLPGDGSVKETSAHAYVGRHVFHGTNVFLPPLSFLVHVTTLLIAGLPVTPMPCPCGHDVPQAPKSVAGDLVVT